jgi:hypothetical protein
LFRKLTVDDYDSVIDLLSTKKFILNKITLQSIEGQMFFGLWKKTLKNHITEFYGGFDKELISVQRTWHSRLIESNEIIHSNGVIREGYNIFSPSSYFDLFSYMVIDHIKNDIDTIYWNARKSHNAFWKRYWNKKNTTGYIYDIDYEYKMPLNLKNKIAKYYVLNKHISMFWGKACIQLR